MLLARDLVEPFPHVGSALRRVERCQRLRRRAPGEGHASRRAQGLSGDRTGRPDLKLADPTDLPFPDDLLDDDGLVDEVKVLAAVEDLIKRKPHLAARRPTGNVGQGARPETPEIGLAAMLRRGA